MLRELPEMRSSARSMKVATMKDENDDDDEPTELNEMRIQKKKRLWIWVTIIVIRWKFDDVKFDGNFGRNECMRWMYGECAYEALSCFSKEGSMMMMKMLASSMGVMISGSRIRVGSWMDHTTMCARVAQTVADWLVGFHAHNYRWAKSYFNWNHLALAKYTSLGCTIWNKTH